MTLTIRPVTHADSADLAALINRIIARGGTTAFREPFTPDGLWQDMLMPAGHICCHLADLGSGPVGFQALFWADPDWDGPDPLPADWALISTYVDLGVQGQGVGRALFRATLAAARAAGVTRMNATIRRENAGGLAYYSGMGFRDWRSDSDTLSKRFDLADPDQPA